ncbi:uncharacterized protein LOC127722997 [Mytilus californianus]|uniref:uncharacterized protein LOC127722997 n=1 Tax=Mytilus californianus TaxID=6549 RepID=UPI002246D365|nr:uncharacterized protein LOC127722997 [Mytilus californianus]
MKCVLHKIFNILIPLLLLVTKGGTEDDDNCFGNYDAYDNTYSYYCDPSSDHVAIIGGVFGGLVVLGLIVTFIVIWYCNKTKTRPGRVVNPTTVPTVTRTQFGGTYGNNFSHHTTTQFGTAFTYGQQQQSQDDPYPPPPAYNY